MRVNDVYVEIGAGEYADQAGGELRVYYDAEALVFHGQVTVLEGGRAIILGGQLFGEADVEDGGQVWVCNRGMARIYSGGEGFAVVGSCVAVEPGGILHMYSEQEWPEEAERTWKEAGGRGIFTFGDRSDDDYDNDN